MGGGERQSRAFFHVYSCPRFRVLSGNFAGLGRLIAGCDLLQFISRTQITRHDCIEGWSAIGKWTGVPLSEVLAVVQPQPQARYVVFYCADTMDDGGRYYESVDLDDAYHPQTILAYALNGRTLPVANGAPLRVRIERQLGYKMAKYIMRIELAETLKTIAGGRGGYWEDRGYEWYAGI
jgi:DMSO/TMAO reductase YedYZ molybdopterin-dependent catalytic subunit